MRVSVRMHVCMFMCYLGNGSGAASPSVEHHSILVSFLQHLILHKRKRKQRHHSFLMNSWGEKILSTKEWIP